MNGLLGVQLAAGGNPEGDDDMGASFGPVQLEQGTTSLVIPPVQAGIPDPRKVWLNIGADTFGEAYRLRIWGSNGDGGWFAVGSADGSHTLHSGGVLSIELGEAANAHGLVGMPGSSPDVGVVGYTLGGGLSWFARAHGFACRSTSPTARPRPATASPPRSRSRTPGRSRCASSAAEL